LGADHFDYCLDQVRQGDRDRYLTLLFAPAESRGELAALAAFNLELARTRDQVSESLLGLIRLQWWREAIEEIKGGGQVRQHQVALALAETSRARGLDTDRMLAMIDARDSEMESAEPPSEAEFTARADATAGSLLALSLQVLGHDSSAPGLADAVRSVGRAYAAAGIARSVLADARRRHTRLPREKLAAARVDLDRLYELKPQPALTQCLRAVADQAERDLSAARAFRQAKSHGAKSHGAKSHGAKSPLVLTARLAALHLERLRRAAYDPFDPAVVAAHPMDAWRLLWSNLTGRF
jgi:phytoene synthase